MKGLRLKVNDETVCIAGRSDSIRFNVEFSADNSGNGKFQAVVIGLHDKGKPDGYMSVWPSHTFTFEDVLGISMTDLRDERQISEPQEFPKLERVAYFEGNLRCSFCGKGEKEVESLVAGAEVYICNGCNEIVSEINSSSD